MGVQQESAAHRQHEADLLCAHSVGKDELGPGSYIVPSVRYESAEK